MKKQFTPQQKKEHFTHLRRQWQQAKNLAASDPITAIYSQLREMGIARDISIYNISLIMMQAQSLGLEGLPYLDFKTYEGWKKSGFQVKRGEKSPVYSITWVGAKGEEGEDSGARWPKLTHLFHSSQVEDINERKINNENFCQQ